MQRMKLVSVLIVLATFALSACGAGGADATPTLSVSLIQTLAVITYQAQLTQTALAMPTSTPAPTESLTPAATLAVPSALPGAVATSTTGGQSSSCYALTFVKDVTIPDGTEMTPGQSFTKTWQVSNSGTCAWEAGFTWNVIAGEAMGGVAVILNQRVEPGRQYEFSVPMVAPTNKTGTLRGTWRLSDANGNFFGDSPWVEISVGGAAPTSTGAAATATTAPATETESSTATP
jgi:Ig-like domain from next to BRCA1 gene